MKRSKMLEVLTDFIEKEYGPTSEQGRNVSFPSAVALLDLIEDMGMLPPFDPEIYHKSWRDGGSGHEWEQE